MVDEPESADLGDEDLGDASTKAGVAKQRRAAKRRADEEAAVIKMWLSTEQSRAFLAKLIFSVCGVDKPITNLAMNDGYTLFREGARQVGLDLQNRALQADRQQYMVLLSETLGKM